MTREGPLDEAIALARAAAETSRRRGTGMYEAYELTVLAHALAQAGEPHDIVAAEADDLAQTIGSVAVSHELVRRGPVEPGRPTTIPSGLRPVRR